VKHAASVHPEPGSNSPLKKNRHNQAGGNNTTPGCTKFETSQKHHAHHGVAAQHIQPIHKTIGINKLGTLLSSQTTDTPGTTTTKQTVADRSGATFQTYRLTSSVSNRRSRSSSA
ncbi:hypothetical protein, partial [Pseudarthrobacter sp. efr-133-R2A-89]|uniref:hypothetical protein n=1 Tax=Pseudarthrobacter sp. efr-133-R2A-89 TaxID=3040302 RepID=UPI002553B264